MQTTSKSLLALILTGVTVGSVACNFRNLSDERPMRPSITFLHLLRHTPFFTKLETDQLQWVIDHSREWEVKSGTTILSDQKTKNGYWILLDGAWNLEIKGQSFPFRHGDPGKWFNSAFVGSNVFKLSTTDHSYIMEISDSDMKEMLDKGFRFDNHLVSGKNFYRSFTQNDSTGSLAI